jgi:hypothetical protein
MATRSARSSNFFDHSVTRLIGTDDSAPAPTALRFYASSSVDCKLDLPEELIMEPIHYKTVKARPLFELPNTKRQILEGVPDPAK